MIINGGIERSINVGGINFSTIYLNGTLINTFKEPIYEMLKISREELEDKIKEFDGRIIPFGGAILKFNNKEDANDCFDWIESVVLMNKLKVINN